MFPQLIGLLGKIVGQPGGAGAVAAGPVAAGASPAAGAGGGIAALMKQAMQAQGALPPTATPVPQAATGLAALTKSMEPLASAIGKVQKGFMDVTASAGKLAQGAGFVTEPLKAIVGVLGQFRNSVTALGDQVSQFTQLANPAVTQQFQMAAQDLTAVIGKSLMPVLQFATKFTRGFADVLQQVAGPLANVINSGLKPLGDFIPVLVNTLGPVVRTLGNFLNMIAAVTRPINTVVMALAKVIALPLEAILSGLAAVLELLMAPITALAELLGQLATAFDKFISRGIADLRKLLGLPTAAGSSVGAAVRPASFSGVEDFEKKFFAQAFSLGTAAGPEERTAGYAGQLVELMSTLPERMWAYIQNMPGTTAQKLWEVIRQSPGFKAVSSIGEVDLRAGVDTAAGYFPGGPAAVAAGRRVDDEIQKGWNRLRGRRADDNG